jgi:hypothetical protein
METQRTVAELNKLTAHEENLLNKLAEKRKALISATCIKAVRNKQWSEMD